MKVTIAVITALMISGCCGVKQVESVALPLPPPIPQEKRLTQEELQSVSDETLDKIILLDKRRKTLEGIIKSTHQ